MGKKVCIKSRERWWLIGSASDFRGRGPGFESGSPTMILMHCCRIIVQLSRKSQGREVKKIYTNLVPASMDMNVSGSCSSRWVPPVLTVMSVLGRVICMFTEDRPAKQTSF